MGSDENGLKCLPCVLWDNVLCSYRKDAKFGVMARCFKCGEYERFMREMDSEEDEFFVEVERENRFAKCMFEACLCDGELGKLACFGYKLVGDGEVWTCRRFCLEKLKADSVMREAYLSLFKGAVVK